MPLIIICGIPCSGKTKRANELKRIMETYAPSEKDNNEAGKSSKKSSVESTEEPPKQQKKEVKLLKEKRVVHLLNDDSFGLDRIKTYSSKFKLIFIKYNIIYIINENIFYFILFYFFFLF